MKDRKFSIEVVENGFLVEEIIPTPEEGPRYKSKIHAFHTVAAMNSYLATELEGEFVTNLDDSDAEYWTKRVVTAMKASATRINLMREDGRGWML